MQCDAAVKNKVTDNIFYFFVKIRLYNSRYRLTSDVIHYTRNKTFFLYIFWSLLVKEWMTKVKHTMITWIEKVRVILDRFINVFWAAVMR